MSSEKSLTPQIRFKGYTEAWEQRKLADIALYTRGGGTPSTSNTAYWNGEIPWIQSSDLSDGKLFGVKPRKHISKAGLSSSATQLVPENSIAVVARVGVGKLAFMSYSYTTSQDFLSLCRLQTKPYFTVYSLYQMLQGELQAVQGTSIKGITKDDLLSKSIFVPNNINEQQQIGSFFGNLDTLITLHQRKLDALKKIKSALLEKMFPKDGSNIPEIRFAGYTEAWEQRKLGELGQTYNGLTGKNKDDFGHGRAQYITYMNVFSNPICDLALTEKIEVDQKQNEVEIGDVFFTTSSETPEEVGMSSVLTEKQGITYLNSFCFGYRPLKKIDLNYLAYMLRSNTFRKNITFLAQGISRYNISKTKVMDVSIHLPTTKEQYMVGTFFKNLDSLITLHQRKLDALKKIKSALLEKMFV